MIRVYSRVEGETTLKIVDEWIGEIYGAQIGTDIQYIE
jgi:hypothetical protein